MFFLFISFYYNKIFHTKIIINNFCNISLSLIKDNLTFIINNPKSYISYKFDLIKYIYQIQVFDSNYRPILPSDLTLFHGLNIICFSEITNSINIYSLSIVVEDKFFRCIEFSRPNEKIKFGFVSYNSKVNKEYVYYYLSNKLFNYNFEDENIFDSIKINNEYLIPYSQLNNNNIQVETNKLKNSYISKPIYDLKRNSINKENKWNFMNIFNDYFCLCKGLNCLNFISKSCKYYFYLYLIDLNKNVYKKTDFLLMDFVLKKYSADDVFPVFEEMINQNLSAHYFIEKEDIYQKYCRNKNYCELIIQADKNNDKINGDFLEKHLNS